MTTINCKIRKIKWLIYKKEDNLRSAKYKYPKSTCRVFSKIINLMTGKSPKPAKRLNSISKTLFKMICLTKKTATKAACPANGLSIEASWNQKQSTEKTPVDRHKRPSKGKELQHLHIKATLSGADLSSWTKSKLWSNISNSNSPSKESTHQISNYSSNTIEVTTTHSHAIVLKAGKLIA